PCDRPVNSVFGRRSASRRIRATDRADRGCAGVGAHAAPTCLHPVEFLAEGEELFAVGVFGGTLAWFGAFAAAEVVFAEGELSGGLEETLLKIAQIAAMVLSCCQRFAPASVVDQG